MNSFLKRKQTLERNDLVAPLLTMREASQILNVHSNTLRRWSAKGLIKSYRVGIAGQRRFKVEDIDALLAEQHKH